MDFNLMTSTYDHNLVHCPVMLDGSWDRGSLPWSDHHQHLEYLSVQETTHPTTKSVDTPPHLTMTSLPLPPPPIHTTPPFLPLPGFLTIFPHLFTNPSPSYNPHPPPKNPEKPLTFIPMLPSPKRKRARRRPDEINRIYPCPYPHCPKSYGTINNLNAHLVMQRHGEKRVSADFPSTEI